MATIRLPRRRLDAAGGAAALPYRHTAAHPAGAAARARAALRLLRALMGGKKCCPERSTFFLDTLPDLSHYSLRASLAQLVEQLIRNQQVKSSSLLAGSRENKDLRAMP